LPMHETLRFDESRMAGLQEIVMIYEMVSRDLRTGPSGRRGEGAEYGSCGRGTGRRIRALALWLRLMQQRPVSRNYS
jgi:hypothetical protein